jgi:MFS family permease
VIVLVSFVTLTLVMGSRFTFGVFYPSSGILRSVGSVIWGSISDRTTREGSFTISAGLGLIALPCLISVQTSPDAWRVVLFVLLIGLGYGGASVLYGMQQRICSRDHILAKFLGFWTWALV